MRDLEKIKPKKAYGQSILKFFLIMATGIASGIAIFLLGIVLNNGKNNKTAESALAYIDNLGAKETKKLQQDTEQPNQSEDNFTYEFTQKLMGNGNSLSHPDEPLPAVPNTEVSNNGNQSYFRIPQNPAEVAFVEPVRAPVSVKGEKGIFTLHVNSFSNKAEAAGYVLQLRKMGYKAFLVATETENQMPTLYRVRIGPFLSKNEAEKYRKEFEEKEGIPTFVVKRVLKE